MDDQYKDTIIEASPAKRNQSKRPDRGRIAKYVASKNGLSQNRTIEIIEKLLPDAVVCFKINKQGKESFYVSKLRSECTTQDESAVESDDEFHDLLETPSTPIGVEVHDGPSYDHQDLSDESRIHGKPMESNLQSHSDSTKSIGGAKFRTQYATKNKDSVSLANIIGKMAKSISELNAVLNCERNKTEDLLTENFSLKFKNQELQTLVENLLNSQKSEKKSEIASSCKTLEIHSELITEADRHHKETTSENDAVNELSKNEQPTENKHKRPSKAKRKSLQRQKKPDNNNNLRDSKDLQLALNQNSNKISNNNKTQHPLIKTTEENN